MEERNNRLLNAKLNKYIVPGIMMSLALQLGNIVDTIFVSNLIGVEAMSAVTLSLPVETLVQLRIQQSVISLFHRFLSFVFSFFKILCRKTVRYLNFTI